MINKFYKDQNRKLDIDYINLDKFYKKSETFTNNEIETFINENEDKLKQDFIDFSYVDISPKNLIGLEEFNQEFFDKIDDIENQISKNIDFKTIIQTYNLSPTLVKSYIRDDKQIMENKIYELRNNKIEIFENNGKYILYNIDQLITRLPDFDNDKFKTQIKDLLFKKKNLSSIKIF